MKKVCSLLMVLCIAVCYTALAENQYYYVEQGVEIVDGGVYTAMVHAGNDGWEWSISENKDITAWNVKEDGSPAFAEESGIVIAHLVYGPFEGAEGDVALQLEVVMDMSKVTAFTENGAFDLYIQPLELDSATICMKMENFDSSLVTVVDAQIVLLEGDGYYPYNYQVEGAQADTWTDGECVVTLSALTGKFGMRGGDGNGHYNMRIGVTGLAYNGLPIAMPVLRTDIYAFGRTFLSDHGSLIWFAEPQWTSEEECPVLCDVYLMCSPLPSPLAWKPLLSLLRT